jgi:hypothetical protein
MYKIPDQVGDDVNHYFMPVSYVMPGLTGHLFFFISIILYQIPGQAGDDDEVKPGMTMRSCQG